MNLSAPGSDILPVEVTHVSSYGIWLLVSAVEYFVPYDQFPWFKNARLADILNVEELRPGHLYWSDLDVDLGIESIEHPQRFPLVSM